MDGEEPTRGPVGTSSVGVRPARPGDALAIARVQGVTWRVAYRSVLPPSVLDGWDDDAAAATWRSAIAGSPAPGRGVLVALERELVVGFAAYAPADPDDAAPEPAAAAGGPPVEIAPLLVEPRWGRRGHGSRLLAAVADLTRREGAVALRAWVPEADRVSARFLESAGWAPAGWARTLDTGTSTLREILWHTDVRPAGPDEEERS